MCKEFGGAGIPNLRDLNISLLGSLVSRYQADDRKLRKELIDFKYNTKRPNIFYSNEVGGSDFFKDFMWAAKAAKMGFRWSVGNGKKSIYGRITGWGIPAWLFNIGLFMC